MEWECRAPTTLVTGEGEGLLGKEDGETVGRGADRGSWGKERCVGEVKLGEEWL